MGFSLVLHRVALLACVGALEAYTDAQGAEAGRAS